MYSFLLDFVEAHSKRWKKTRSGNQEWVPEGKPELPSPKVQEHLRQQRASARQQKQEESGPAEDTYPLKTEREVVRSLTSGAEIRKGLRSASLVSFHPGQQPTATGQRKLLSLQSPLCACTSVTDLTYWQSFKCLPLPSGALWAHGAAAPHRSLLAIHLHLAPVSSVAMKATGPDNAQTQVSPPGCAPSVEDPTGSQTVSSPHKDCPHPFLSRSKPPTRISSALLLKTDSALERTPRQLPSLHVSQG
ncbi:transcription factor NF-E4-like [Symphalangus syndactylus]|uniref:transcription factor NF-E4-like n=1 Tax=Symphalangus syndactylus TaxID=9590 RepID=UPI0024427F09|nr:transcription factor NF-E4-like [Symphalangus syndactylus]